MIQLENVHKSFGAQVVLNGVNLTIPTGRITVILGPSGTGKSVTIKHMIGLLHPDQGRVLVDDVDPTSLDGVALTQFRRRFGMVFQNAALFDSMNVFDNVAFPLREAGGFTDAQIENRVQEYLHAVGLENVDEKLPSELSGGMRKRVGLARAIVLKPQIILYDEPTTGLDPLMTDQIDRLIVSTQHALRATSVVISHDITSTFRIADQIAMLYRGKIVAFGSPSEFRNSPHEVVRRFVEGRSEESSIVGQL